MIRAALLLAGALLTALTASAQAPRMENGEAWIWAAEHHQEAWRLLTADLGSGEAGGEIAWIARIAEDDAFSATTELIVRQPHPGKGPARAAYVRSLGDNIMTQMYLLREASPAIDLARAVRDVRVRGGTVDAVGCPVIARLAGRLPGIEVKAMPVDYLVLDGGSFEVTLTPTFRPARHYVVDVGEDDLATWCAEIIAAIVECEGRPARE